MTGRHAAAVTFHRLEKSAQLLRLLTKDRREFVDRVAAICEVRSQWLWGKPPSYYDAMTIDDGIDVLGRTLNADIRPFLNESSFTEFEAGMSRAKQALPATAPMGRFHNADDFLVRIVYALARAIAPSRIVETGVCYGVTTGYLLQALHENCSGHLNSIDLPPLGENADSFVGCLVPKELKDRWTLHRGSSRRLLTRVLRGQGSIQMFVHDSLHTRANMRREFATAWPFMSTGSVLVSDDIEGNSAFAELASMSGVRCSVVLASDKKKALIGVAVKS
jgi:predicted O-methyltransferase YrrM